MAHEVTLIPGDGVGPEVVEAARRVVDAAAERFGFAVDWTEVLAGGIAIDTHGVAIRPEDVDACGAADAILLGAVGGPKWSDPEPSTYTGAPALSAARSVAAITSAHPPSLVIEQSRRWNGSATMREVSTSSIVNGPRPS